HAQARGHRACPRDRARDRVLRRADHGARPGPREHDPPPDPGPPPPPPLHGGHGQPRDPGDLRDRRPRGHAARGSHRGGGTAGPAAGVPEPGGPEVHPRGAGGNLMERTRVNIVVGVFMVLGMVALGYLSIQLGRVSFLGARGYRVTVDFPSVGGLKAGSTVEIAGVEIGRVDSIGLDNYQARVILRVQTGVKLQEDSIASIKTKGLIDDPSLKDKPKDKRVAVRKIADDIFDFGETAKRSLGRHWAARTEAERDEFVKLFGDLLERSYISKIELYGGEKIQYLSDRTE